MVLIYCDSCRSSEPMIIEEMKSDALNGDKIWGDLVCGRCTLVIATIEVDKPGKYEFTLETIRKSKFDFEPIYSLYPRKMGKSQGFKKCQKEIKTDGDYNDLKMAIMRFTRFHKEQGTEPNFIPYFGTFMTSWKDWLEADTGKIIPTGNPQSFSPLHKKEDEPWPETDPQRIKQLLSQVLSRKRIPVESDHDE